MLLSKNNMIKNKIVEHLQVFPLFPLLLVVVEVEGGRGRGYKEGTVSKYHYTTAT